VAYVYSFKISLFLKFILLKSLKWRIKIIIFSFPFALDSKEYSKMSDINANKRQRVSGSLLDSLTINSPSGLSKKQRLLASLSSSIHSNEEESINKPTKSKSKTPKKLHSSAVTSLIQHSQINPPETTTTSKPSKLKTPQPPAETSSDQLNSPITKAGSKFNTPKPMSTDTYSNQPATHSRSSKHLTTQMSPSPHVLVSAATSIQTANQSAYSTVDKPTVATRLFEKKSDKIKKKKTINKSVLTAATSSTSSSSSSSDKDQAIRSLQIKNEVLEKKLALFQKDQKATHERNNQLEELLATERAKYSDLLQLTSPAEKANILEFCKRGFSHFGQKSDLLDIEMHAPNEDATSIISTKFPSVSIDVHIKHELEGAIRNAKNSSTSIFRGIIKHIVSDKDIWLTSNKDQMLERFKTEILAAHGKLFPSCFIFVIFA
jgi:hypothetical protein